MMMLFPVAIGGAAVAVNAAKGLGFLISAVKIADNGRTLMKNLHEVRRTKKEQELLRTEDAMKTAAIAVGIGLAGYACRKFIDKQNHTHKENIQ